jgi:hypothetical protein
VAIASGTVAEIWILVVSVDTSETSMAMIDFWFLSRIPAKFAKTLSNLSIEIDTGVYRRG